MSRWLLIATSIYVFGWSIVERAHAVPVTGFVDARTNLYKASPSGGGDGFDPFSFSFTAGTGGELTFSSVTGGTHCCSGDPLGGGSTNPDGLGGLPNTNINASGGISGIFAPGTMFLTGVFIDSTADFGTAPDTLNYFVGPSTQQSVFSPLMNQAFFIGDGRTGIGNGATQIFQVPDFADRLFLGFVDGAGFTGPPSFFGDNTGGLNFVGDISGISPVPVPAGILFFLTMISSFAILGWRRSQASCPA